jgi:Tfp pilus assembly protein PilX
MKTHENVKEPFPVTTRGKRVKTLNEEGIILVVVMFLLAVLSLIALAAGRSVTTDTAVAGNYLGSIQALYVAEAGLERAKNECAQRYVAGSWPNYNTILRGADGVAGNSDDGILTFGSSVSFHGGSYAAKALNDNGDSGAASTDTNKAITIESTGTYGSSTARVRTTIKMNEIMDLPGAVNLIGGNTTSFKSSASILVDGHNYPLTGDTPLDGPPSTPTHYGISVGDVAPKTVATAEAEIKATIDAKKYDIVAGKDGTTSNPSLGENTTVTKANLREFVDAIKSVADNNLTDPPDLTGNSGEGNCVMIGTQNACLGTTASPKITYISASADTGWEIKGSIVGVGLLVVDGENLTFAGNLSWTGVVIVLGKNIGFTDKGGGNQDIRGGLLVGEYSATDGGIDLNINGNVKLYYSQPSIDLVNTAIRNSHRYSVLSWQRVY